MNATNPLLANDPALNWLVVRFGLSPLGVFYLTFLLLPVLLFLICLRNGTLRINATDDNPHGHGFVSTINLYLIVVPFLNYAIFSYYDAYAVEIGALYRLGILSGTGGIGGFFQIFNSRLAFALTAVGYLLGVGLSINGITWHRRKQHISYTSWLCNSGNPRLANYVFHFVFFVLELGIVFNWCLRHVLVWIRLNSGLRRAHVYPFHADHMFGLGPLRDLTWYSFEVVTLLFLLVALWLMGARITRSREPLFRNPGHPAAVMAMVFLGPLIVLLPLEGPHTLIENAKRLELSRISERDIKLSNYIEEQISKNLLDEHVPELIKAMANETLLYRFIEESSAWAIPPSNALAMMIGFLNPLIVAFAIELGARFYERFRPGNPQGPPRANNSCRPNLTTAPL